jgi:hypothetical protein
MAIRRIWRGWTTPDNAEAYRRVLELEVRPGIEAMEIPGYRSLELMSRDLGDEVEFMTVMTFDSIENVLDLQGEDYERAYVPDAARAVLSRWDDVCLHYEVLECSVRTPTRKPDDPMPLPDLIVHADWGSDPKKRWMCLAVREEGRYAVDAPIPVGDLHTLWERTTGLAGGGSVLVGFDFPIGVPAAYARRAEIGHFKDALGRFGQGRWSEFYDVCRDRDEVSLERPFYPYGTKGVRRDHLMEGLGLTDPSDLLRRCERPTASRGAASPLFWTLGGKQVGRAAIIGWKHLLAPALNESSIDLRLWPFDGSLAETIEEGAIVVAETYPAEACLHLGLVPPGRTWSKTSQSGRASQAGQILRWAEERGVLLSERLRDLLLDGFGPAKSAEDPFDAMLGALSMVEVASGDRPEGAPRAGAVTEVEGWILGQLEG